MPGALAAQTACFHPRPAKLLACAFPASRAYVLPRKITVLRRRTDVGGGGGGAEACGAALCQGAAHWLARLCNGSLRSATPADWLRCTCNASTGDAGLRAAGSAAVGSAAVGSAAVESAAVRSAAAGSGNGGGRPESIPGRARGGLRGRGLSDFASNNSIRSALFPSSLPLQPAATARVWLSSQNWQRGAFLQLVLCSEAGFGIKRQQKDCILFAFLLHGPRCRVNKM